jgi:hypothetical protein
MKKKAGSLGISVVIGVSFYALAPKATTTPNELKGSLGIGVGFRHGVVRLHA